MFRIWPEDVRHAARSLARGRRFVFAAVLTLALGIAANSAVFAFANAILFSRLPYESADRLVKLWENERGKDPHWTVSPANLDAWRTQADAFEGMAAFNVNTAAFSLSEGAEQLHGAVVEPGLLELLGVKPILGRTFTGEEGEEDGPDVVILGYDLWQRSFGGRRDVIGEEVRIDGEPHEVVGVLPRTYRNPDIGYPAADMLRPLSLRWRGNLQTGRYVGVVARLRQGVTVKEAREQMDVIAGRLESEFPERNEGWGVTLAPIREALFGNGRTAVMLLVAGATVVLLAVAANLANLMLARQAGRARELAVMAALGAERRRIVRQLSFEALLLAGGGAALGFVLVVLSGGVLHALSARAVSEATDLHVDGNVVLFTALTGAFIGLVAGIWPALRATTLDLRETLGSTHVLGSRRTRRLRQLLISAEIGLAVMLLLAGILLARSFERLVHVPKGFDARNVLTFDAALPSDNYPDRDRVLGATDELMQRLSALPGVRAVGVVSTLPFTIWNSFGIISIDGAATMAEVKIISPSYLTALHMSVLEGDAPLPPEQAGGVERVAVNQTFAQRYLKGKDPLDQTIKLDRRDARIGALVEDELDDGFLKSHEPLLYRSYRALSRRDLVYVVRVAGDPASHMNAVRRTVAAYDPEIALADMQSLESLVDDTVAGRHASMLLVVVFALTTLLISIVGIYGVLAHSVANRTNEFGLRLALGARVWQVAGLVLRDYAWMTAIGCTAGLVAGAFGARLLTAFLFGIPALDPVSMALTVGLVAATSLASALLPARRAAGIAPAVALQEH